MRGLRVELRCGRELIARAGVAALGTRAERVVLHRAGGVRFVAGRYELTVIERGRVIARQALVLHH